MFTYCPLCFSYEGHNGEQDGHGPAFIGLSENMAMPPSEGWHCPPSSRDSQELLPMPVYIHGPTSPLIAELAIWWTAWQLTSNQLIFSLSLKLCCQQRSITRCHWWLPTAYYCRMMPLLTWGLRHHGRYLKALPRAPTTSIRTPGWKRLP